MALKDLWGPEAFWDTENPPSKGEADIHITQKDGLEKLWLQERLQQAHERGSIKRIPQALSWPKHNGSKNLKENLEVNWYSLEQYIGCIIRQAFSSSSPAAITSIMVWARQCKCLKTFVARDGCKNGKNIAFMCIFPMYSKANLLPDS